MGDRIAVLYHTDMGYFADIVVREGDTVHTEETLDIPAFHKAPSEWLKSQGYRVVFTTEEAWQILHDEKSS